MQCIRRLLAVFLVPALMLGWSAVAFAAASTPVAGDTEEPPQTEPTVFVRQDPALGTILTDAKGMTLYQFKSDTTKGESTCYDQCAQNWPAFTATEPLSLPAEMTGKLSTIKRTDGTTQVAYNDIPLYYFAKDTAAGQTNGQGVGDVWYVVAPGQQFGHSPEPAGTPAPDLGTPAAAGDIQVTLTEMSVAASATTFKVGETYTFAVTNQGKIEHELVFEKAGDNDVPLESNGKEVELENIAPGSSKSLDFAFTEPGIYQLACHVPGHYAAGMVLTIYVVA
jgi:predicted lipoprotein with Yx(FWY)xxD motif/plastocyanin